MNYSQWKQIAYDPVERRSLMRLTIHSKDAIGHGIQNCWCGETNGFSGLFLYAFQYLRSLDARPGAPDPSKLYQISGVFCSVGCMRDKPYYGQNSPFKDLIRKVQYQ